MSGTEPLSRGRLLTALARAVIARRFGLTAAALPHPGWLDAPGAAFVTLTLNGALRGCIGSLEAHRGLAADIEANAQAAAFADPRFPPLGRDELDKVRVEVSILSPPEPFRVRDEADALARLRPGIDGVILSQGIHRATFLPQVWEVLPEPRDFLAQLKRKAGLPADFWAPDLRLMRYRVEKHAEGEGE